MSASSSRAWHRVLGLALLLPLLAWCVTGLLFHWKPGWAEAYETPSLRFLPLGDASVPRIDADWLELRRVRTVLGEHLLVRTAQGRRHLDPATGEDRAAPSAEERIRLLDDALADRPRYGEVRSLRGWEATTRTGVRLRLDWERLSLSQRGSDTDRIDALYRVHYLQWTGHETVDRALGLCGLAALASLAALGARLAFRRAP